MKRLLTVALTLNLLAFAGCGSVRGLRVASTDSPCFGTPLSPPSCVLQPSQDYSPLPESSAPHPPVNQQPQPAAEEELPPPPPTDFEVTGTLQRTKRKPILNPLRESAGKIVEKTTVSTVDFYGNVKDRAIGLFEE